MTKKDYFEAQKVINSCFATSSLATILIGFTIEIVLICIFKYTSRISLNVFENISIWLSFGVVGCCTMFLQSLFDAKDILKEYYSKEKSIEEFYKDEELKKYFPTKILEFEKPKSK